MNTDIIEKAAANLERVAGQNTEIMRRLEQLELKGDMPSNPAGHARSDEHMKAFTDFLRNPKSPRARGELEEVQKAISIGSSADGGYAVPEILSREIAKRLVDLSPLRSLCRVVSVSNGDFRMLTNVNGASSGWVGEGGTRSATSTPQLAEVRPAFGTLYAYVSASEEAVHDMQFDVGSWLVDNIAEEFARAEGAAVIAGSGSDQPRGFLTTAPVSTGDSDSPARTFGTLQYIATGAAGAFPNDQTGSPPGNPGDVLWDTVYSLRAGYRANARWLMNSATAATVRKWKDADGRYLWQDNLIAGQPARLCGYPIVICEDMPDIGSNTIPIAFGDFFRGYLLADVVGLRISVDDNITTPGQVKWYVRRRLGGRTLDDHAIRVIKCSAS